jgi:hypothetical protein
LSERGEVTRVVSELLSPESPPTQPEKRSQKSKVLDHCKNNQAGRNSDRYNRV